MDTFLHSDPESDPPAPSTPNLPPQEIPAARAIGEETTDISAPLSNRRTAGRPLIGARMKIRRPWTKSKLNAPLLSTALSKEIRTGSLGAWKSASGIGLFTAALLIWNLDLLLASAERDSMLNGKQIPFTGRQSS